MQYYHLPLHHAATTAVHMAGPAPEIMDEGITFQFLCAVVIIKSFGPQKNYITQKNTLRTSRY
jgi:hypothetical protein